MLQIIRVEMLKLTVLDKLGYQKMVYLKSYK